MVEFLRVHGLQDRHNNPQQLFWVLEGLHIKVRSGAVSVQCVQLAPADITSGQRWDRVRLDRRLCNHSLPLGLVKAISRLCRC
jgi:hypothetical protein